MADIDLERVKTFQDTFKHMTTFSSGAILLASAVTGALFTEPILTAWLASSISLLAIGALFAMFGLAFVPRHIASGTVSTGWLHGILWLSVGATYIGITVFSVFAVANLVPQWFGG